MREPPQQDRAQTFGRYSLLTPIGSGGMAEVWKAKAHGARDFERIVVIKRILRHLCQDPKFVEMFTAEARLSARLSHPNIVQVFDFGEWHGEYFLAMEYIDGVTLSTVVDQMLATGPVPVGLALRVVRDVALALGYAHALTGSDGRPLGIVHRDVSPSNVMLGIDGTVKLLDFGVAKAASLTDEKTRTGVLKGKLAYMPPELVDGNSEVDQRVDLFAVGVMLHELLVGRRLFRGRDDFHTIALVRACVVPPPSETRKDLPPGLDEICLKALARDPEKRFQSGAELAATLTPLLHDLRWDTTNTANLVAELVRSPAVAAREPTAATAEGHRRQGGSSTDDVKPLPRRPVWTAGITLLSAAVALACGFALGRNRPSGAIASQPTKADGTSLVLVASEPPDATVKIDGETQPETTPTAIRGIAGGRHLIRIYKEGFDPVDRPVDLKDHERTLIDVVLAPASRSISITTVPPGAQVFVNGKLTASMTPAVLALKNGDIHELRFQKLGFKTRVVAIDPDDKEASKMVTLEPAHENVGALIVDSTGPANVWIDGVDSGFLTPTIPIEVAAGEHTIELRSPAGVLARQRIKVRTGETASTVLALPKGVR
jgi:serine/threonine-protein kinase